MNIFFKHEKFFLLCIFLNNALMAMDNNVKLLPRTEQEKFQPKKLIRIKGNENNGNTFWFDRKLLAPCAWLDQMLMLSESESLAHNDPKQPLVLPTAFEDEEEEEEVGPTSPEEWEEGEESPEALWSGA
jgi:hypothetical protein